MLHSGPRRDQMRELNRWKKEFFSEQKALAGFMVMADVIEISYEKNGNRFLENKVATELDIARLGGRWCFIGDWC